ncbi:MAG: hypothetical protein HUU20_06760, partial [Pirellulales bacterium]|nr:hypothetical protein [Pirellulales bacterium]
MEILGVIAGLLAITGAGSAAVLVLRPGDEDLEPAAALGWSFVFGSALFGLVLYVPLALWGQVSHAWFAATAALGWCAGLGAALRVCQRRLA